MNIKDFDSFSRSVFNINELEFIDSSINGIQVENELEIKKIAFAVDASLEVFNRAKKLAADLLFVHHGLFWKGQMQAIRGNFYKKISFLIENKIGLYACHLPLDINKEYGNSAYYIKALNKDFNVEKFYPEFKYNKINIGYVIELKEYIAESEIYDFFMEGQSPLAYIKRKEKIKTIGFVPGGGLSGFNEAINLNLDIFITGDANHIYYSLAQENFTSLLSMGHYNSERGGALLFMEKVKNEFSDLEVEFIELRTKM